MNGEQPAGGREHFCHCSLIHCIEHGDRRNITVQGKDTGYTLCYTTEDSIENGVERFTPHKTVLGNLWKPLLGSQRFLAPPPVSGQQALKNRLV
jgi:hypothetical protein